MLKAIDKKTTALVRELDESALPTFEERGVTVDVAYSALNYKDGLAIAGKSPVVRRREEWGGRRFFETSCVGSKEMSSAESL